jgi:hypothetical protein
MTPNPFPLKIIANDDKQKNQNPQQQPAQTVVVVPAQATASSNGMDGGLGLGRVHRRLARRGIGMY